MGGESSSFIKQKSIKSIIYTSVKQQNKNKSCQGVELILSTNSSINIIHVRRNINGTAEL